MISTQNLPDLGHEGLGCDEDIKPRKSSLERLPIELKILVIRYLLSILDLRALTFTCSSIWPVYEGQHHLVQTTASRNEVWVTTFENALFVLGTQGGFHLLRTERTLRRSSTNMYKARLTMNKRSIPQPIQILTPRDITTLFGVHREIRRFSKLYNKYEMGKEVSYEDSPTFGVPHCPG